MVTSKHSVIALEDIHPPVHSAEARDGHDGREEDSPDGSKHLPPEVESDGVGVRDQIFRQNGEVGWRSTHEAYRFLSWVLGICQRSAVGTYRY